MLPMKEIQSTYVRCMGIVQFSHSVVSDSLRPHELQHTRLPCPSTPEACSNICPLSRWWHPTILSSVIPFSSWRKCWLKIFSFCHLHSNANDYFFWWIFLFRRKISSPCQTNTLRMRNFHWVPNSFMVDLDGVQSECICACCHSVLSDSLQTHWTAACQAPLFMEFSRQEYWSGSVSIWLITI